MKYVFSLISLIGILLSSTAVSGQTPPAPPTPVPAVPSLTDLPAGPIRKGDIVRILVTGAENLGGEFRVDTDGTILVPRLGELTLSGKMPAEAARLVEKQLSVRKLLRSPNAAVYIIGRKNREVLINGAVSTQGRQIIRDNAVLAEVLEQAVPGAGADLSRIIITRADNSEIKVDYRQFRNGISNAPEFNPPLNDGDRIYVFTAVPPEGSVRLTGEVKDSSKPVFPILQGTTVGQLLRMAGGLTDYADSESIVLLRGGERIPIRYADLLKAKPDADPVLRDRDEIIVPRLDRRRQFSVAGAVRDPRAFPLSTPVTLLEAIGDAGGPTDGAQQNRVEIRRKDADGRITTIVRDLKKDSDATTQIREGDYVFVPFGRRRPGIDALSVAGVVSALAVTLGQLRR
ncbi:MAG: SLBB domain-containing protein [Capsulimonadales bacterium]|nr:SLBB domain-containing protein [Capsulimonadales bacterium]